MTARTDALVALGARKLRARLASGAVTARDVTEAFLARIAAREPEVQAWAWHDPEFVRHQAAELDRLRGTGRAIGPLHGLPVGVKDIIDTLRIPTENGTPLDAGRVPLRDAFVVSRLKAAGAVIMGKTVTTELAFLDPGRTRNPHDMSRTPGGSSSGSAAAVASGMVPLAIGTQTGGSVIRPAAFCGVTGFKPSFGRIPRSGVLAQSQSLDTVGVFARDAGDAALLADQLFGHDAGDPATAPAPPPRLLETALSTPPVKPTFAFVRPPGWERAEPQTVAAFEELADALGDQCFHVDLPAHFEDAAELRARINFAEMARCYYRYGRDGDGVIGPQIAAAIRAGGEISARDYLAALDWRDVFNAGLREVFERADALLLPATLGPAPVGLRSTGDAIFNGLWTLCGTPAITLPLLTSEEGLPMGVQLIGSRDNDARLMRTATWLADWADRQQQN